MKSVTLRDVAERANVAISTASIVLSKGRTVGQYSAHTQEAVRRAAKELKYRPHPIARFLRTRETRTIGVLAPTVLNEHLGPIIRGLEETLAERGYNVLVSSSARSLTKESYWLDFFGRRVDGTVVASDGDPEEINLLRRFAARGERAMVLIGCRAEISGVTSVTLDDLAGAREATEYLVKLGHRRIAYIGGRSDALANKHRREGYQAALRGVGLACDPDLVRESTKGAISAGLWNHGIEQCRALFAHAPDTTAVFAFNDTIAAGVVRALTGLGRRVPADVSVIGFDNLYWTEFCTPPLTTVHQPREEIGRAAGRALLDRLGRSKTPVSGVSRAKEPPQQILIRPRLVVRESTAPISISRGMGDR